MFEAFKKFLDREPAPLDPRALTPDEREIRRESVAADSRIAHGIARRQNERASRGQVGFSAALAAIRTGAVAAEVPQRYVEAMAEADSRVGAARAALESARWQQDAAEEQQRQTEDRLAERLHHEATVVAAGDLTAVARWQKDVGEAEQQVFAARRLTDAARVRASEAATEHDRLVRALDGADGPATFLQRATFAAARDRGRLAICTLVEAIRDRLPAEVTAVREAIASMKSHAHAWHGVRPDIAEEASNLMRVLLAEDPNPQHR